ncbi:hypothetical protein [Olivibacter jilunii]|uniref:hypothetical protein n=1 Tax=Olivibacter jilunii TaxID=985016 RepID=UPI003F17E1B0
MNISVDEKRDLWNDFYMVLKNLHCYSIEDAWITGLTPQKGIAPFRQGAISHINTTNLNGIAVKKTVID